MDKFYKAFEKKFRGTKENVKNKLKIYLPILNHIKKDKKIIDIGCGRGEFLELLKENGFKNLTGVDFNKEMLNEIRYKDIQFFTNEGIEFLKKIPSNSVGLISSFHMIEHIEFEKVLTFIKESFRVLDDNGILILETPNPENLKVASENFYLDYTHKKPIPMELLKFTVEFAGFEARVLRLNHKKIGNSIKDVVYNVSPDYAVIGFKNEKMIDKEFFKNNGISLDLTIYAFEERIKNLETRMLNMELKMENENLKSENEKLKNTIENLKTENNNLKTENNNLKNHINNLNNENIRLKQEIEYLNKLYNEVVNSKSWKITKPLRKAINFLRKKKRYTVLHMTTAEEKNSTLSKRAKEIYEELKKELKGEK